MGVWIETWRITGEQTRNLVTPCVGVWIETEYDAYLFLMNQKSHPAWVCGLKQVSTAELEQLAIVTPCVGVWIETVCPPYPHP